MNRHVWSPSDSYGYMLPMWLELITSVLYALCSNYWSSISFDDIFRVSDTYFYNQYNWVINRNCFVLGLSSIAIVIDIALVVLIALYI